MSLASYDISARGACSRPTITGRTTTAWMTWRSESLALAPAWGRRRGAIDVRRDLAERLAEAVGRDQAGKVDVLPELAAAEQPQLVLRFCRDAPPLPRQLAARNRGSQRALEEARHAQEGVSSRIEAIE